MAAERSARGESVTVGLVCASAKQEEERAALLCAFWVVSVHFR